MNKRRKVSEYALRLIEKQKLRYNYGLSERQLLGLVREARQARGNTGERLLEFLESRLDNVVFRSNLARTIPAARQLVNHGHVTVNGQRVDVPSYRVRAGDVISLRGRSQKLAMVESCLASPLPFPTPWLNVNADQRSAQVLSAPDVASVPLQLNINFIVEFYAKRL